MLREFLMHTKGVNIDSIDEKNLILKWTMRNTTKKNGATRTFLISVHSNSSLLTFILNVNLPSRPIHQYSLKWEGSIIAVFEFIIASTLQHILDCNTKCIVDVNRRDETDHYVFRCSLDGVDSNDMESADVMQLSLMLRKLKSASSTPDNTSNESTSVLPLIGTKRDAKTAGLGVFGGSKSLFNTLNLVDRLLTLHID
jgi:hypothetical protein